MKKLVVLTGAGVSAESGLKTFRDGDGLWEGHDVTEVATPQAWAANQSLVLQFYNERRKQALEAKPNAGHLALAALESHFDVQIITQNVDDLHERAGSTKVLHLHGELSKARSTKNPELVYGIKGWELKEGDTCEEGAQLRPHIVWFGEAVPMMEEAINLAYQAEIFIVAGTSSVVYPAASLLDYVPAGASKFLVDPKAAEVANTAGFRCYEEPASTGLEKVGAQLLEEFC
ncbi:MAG: NAD-dependent deacylase [Bacteroidota bacterium]